MAHDRRRKLAISAARLEEALAAGPWLAGDSYSLADINAYTLAATLPSMVPHAANAEATPRLIDWLARMDARPAAQAALAMPNRVPEALRTFSPTLSSQESA